jgi:DNA mismatch repair protein MutL
VVDAIENGCKRYLGIKAPIHGALRFVVAPSRSAAIVMPIAPLPVDVVHLIAAGEVIDSLAAVVRELVENALDAGATRIAVTVDAAQWRVRVADNGTGMPLADLRRAATPHSTSKIYDRQDLWNIHSLGFRGEALHSLAQLADLHIASRIAAHSSESGADASGWAIRYDSHGAILSEEPIAIASGTIVTADQIFVNLPTRRQALPTVAQQLRAIQFLVHGIALCHPQVTWQFWQGDREWFSLLPGSTAQHILPQLLRDVQPTDLQETTVDLAYPEPFIPCPRLSVLLGLPDRCHRRRPDWVRVAVNGRWVQQPELEQTILAAFRRTLPRDRFPVCFVHLHLPPHSVDWNRHPAKAELYLHYLDLLREQVTAAIDQTLRLKPDTLPETLYSERIGRVLKTAEAAASYGQPPSPSLRAIGQLHNRYIIAEHPTGVWLVEQHIAHERVLYEQLCDRWECVCLDSPIILNSLTPTQVEQLERLGLEIDPFGEQSWAVRSAPEALATREDCRDALIELSLGGDLQTAQVATACRTAIRNGTPLSLSDMQTLLNQWQQTHNPRTCPHGRPICLTLEESSLSRFFRRHWVIGKSHGI